MSKIIIGIIALLHVFCIEILICIVAIKLVKRATSKMDSRSTYISLVRTLHVMALIAAVYFIPLVALVICLALNSILVGPIILLILGSTVFVTKKIIIPISESKHLQLVEKYYGKADSSSLLIENNKNNSN